MKDTDIRFFKLWSKRPEFIFLKKKTEDMMSDAISTYKKPFIAFSGGKDSTVMIFIAGKIKKGIDIIHWDYGRYFLPRKMENEIQKIALSSGGNLHVHTSTTYDKLGKEARNILGKEFLGMKLPQLIRENRYDLSMVGLRKEESKKRAVKNIYEKKSMITDFHPLLEWKWQDIWAYIISENVPYLKYYDDYSKIIGIENVRFVTLFDPEFDKFGSSNLDGLINWRMKHKV